MLIEIKIDPFRGHDADAIEVGGKARGTVATESGPTGTGVTVELEP